MGLSASVATIGSVYMAHKKAGAYGIAAIVAFSLLAILVHFIRAAIRALTRTESATPKGGKKKR